MAYVTRNFTIGKPLFWSRIIGERFAKTGNRGFIYGLFFCGSLGIVGVVITLCLPYTAHNPLFQIPLYLCWAVIGVPHYCEFLCTFDDCDPRFAPLWDILKNAFIFVVSGTANQPDYSVPCGNLLLVCLYFYPLLGIFVVTILPAFLSPSGVLQQLSHCGKNS